MPLQPDSLAAVSYIWCLLNTTRGGDQEALLKLCAYDELCPA